MFIFWHWDTVCHVELGIIAYRLIILHCQVSVHCTAVLPPTQSEDVLGWAAHFGSGQILGRALVGRHAVYIRELNWTVESAVQCSSLWDGMKSNQIYCVKVGWFIDRESCYARIFRVKVERPGSALKDLLSQPIPPLHSYIACFLYLSSLFFSIPFLTFLPHLPYWAPSSIPSVSSFST